MNTTDATNTANLVAAILTEQDAVADANPTVKLEKSRYNNPRPTLYAEPWKKENPRRVNVLLHLLAAQTEALSADEEWLVQIDRDRNAIVLDLHHGTDAEAGRAMATLKKVADMVGLS